MDQPNVVHKNVHEALAASQALMGKVLKGSVNPHFKSKYADLADVVAVALPALNSNGCHLWHSMVNTVDQMFVRTTVSHGSSDTHINCDVPLIISKNDMQGMKSAVTYAKRIGAESLTGIAPDDDDGNAAAESMKKVQPVVKPPFNWQQKFNKDDPAHMEVLGEVLKKKGISQEQLGVVAERLNGRVFVELQEIIKGL